MKKILILGIVLSLSTLSSQAYILKICKTVLSNTTGNYDYTNRWVSWEQFDASGTTIGKEISIFCSGNGPSNCPNAKPAKDQNNEENLIGFLPISVQDGYLELMTKATSSVESGIYKGEDSRQVWVVNEQGLTEKYLIKSGWSTDSEKKSVITVTVEKLN